MKEKGAMEAETGCIKVVTEDDLKKGTSELRWGVELSQPGRVGGRDYFRYKGPETRVSVTLSKKRKYRSVDCSTELGKGGSQDKGKKLGS